MKHGVYPKDLSKDGVMAWGHLGSPHTFKLANFFKSTPMQALYPRNALSVGNKLLTDIKFPPRDATDNICQLKLFSDEYEIYMKNTVVGIPFSCSCNQGSHTTTDSNPYVTEQNEMMGSDTNISRRFLMREYSGSSCARRSTLPRKTGLKQPDYNLIIIPMGMKNNHSFLLDILRPSREDAIRFEGVTNNGKQQPLALAWLECELVWYEQHYQFLGLLANNFTGRAPYVTCGLVVGDKVDALTMATFLRVGSW